MMRCISHINVSQTSSIDERVLEVHCPDSPSSQDIPPTAASVGCFFLPELP